MKRRRWIAWSVAILAFGAIAWWAIPQDDPAKAEAARQRAAEEALFKQNESRAESGDVEAQFALAEAYRAGRGVERDAKKAISWYLKAARRGHIRAQYHLGRMFEAGEGAQQNPSKAAEWYRLAARLGHDPDAEFALGEMYYKGRGVPTDYEAAIDWYGRAARGGHPGAQYVYGLAHADGWGVKRDLVEAYKWLTLALPYRAQVMRYDKDYDPEKARGTVMGMMHRFQIEQGAKRAAVWKPESGAVRVVRPGGMLVQPAKPSPSKKDESPAVVLSLGVLDAPIQGSESTTARVTLLVSVPNEDDVPDVCALQPRIQDSVMQNLAIRPIVKAGADLRLAGVHERLRDPINAALGKAMIGRAYIVGTDRPLSPNVLYLTPFDMVTDCDRWAKGAAFRR